MAPNIFLLTEKPTAVSLKSHFFGINEDVY
jgi:hypothetical protein